jgi:hypothetical protein
MSWHYLYHGLSVRSEFPLPEWSVFERGNFGELPAEDVSIRLAPPAAERAEAAGEYRLFAKQAGWFIVRGGREILMTPLPDSRDRRLGEAETVGRGARAFLLGSAWGALLYQRGALLLHASAVRIRGGAVAFCARRGLGKSTLAASFSTLGYPLLSDDLCCVRLSPNEPARLFPSVPRFRLCGDAVAKLGWTSSPPAPDHRHSGKYHHYMTAGAAAEVPLRRIYLLGWGDTHIHRLHGFTALTRLIAAGTWRGRLLISTGDPAGHFNRCAQLLRDVECYEFRRPHDLHRLRETTLHLIEHIPGFEARSA